MYTLDELKQGIIPLATKYDLPAVYLFGSYARGEADENSDLDIAINDLNSKVTDFYTLNCLECELESLFGKKVDLLTLRQIFEATTPIGKRVLESYQKERKIIYEKN